MTLSKMSIVLTSCVNHGLILGGSKKTFHFNFYKMHKGIHPTVWRAIPV